MLIDWREMLVQKRTPVVSNDKRLVTGNTAFGKYLGQENTKHLFFTLIKVFTP